MLNITLTPSNQSEEVLKIILALASQSEKELDIT
jgi:hypothetical protein